MADSKVLPSTVSDAVTAFSLELFKKTSQKQGDGNLFISPNSVFIVMAMLQAGARNATLQQLTSALQLDGVDINGLLADMKTFVSKVSEKCMHVEVNAANRLYPNKERDILDSYLSLVKTYFSTDVVPLDYKLESEKSRQTINVWVEEQTKNKIKELLPSGSISSDTGMVVVNAIYFKGEWLTTFDADDTRPKEFSASKSRKVKVDMMHKELKDVRYGQVSNLDCKVLEILYKGRDLGMVILLPNDIEGLAKLEDKLNLKEVKQAVKGARTQTVIVHLPKFKLESTIQMKPVLSALGMADIFDVSKADFTGMGEDLFVSEVFHKGFVDVNEMGTEAAAASAAVMLLGCAMNRAPPITFIADHPFMFLIWDHRVDAPLFVGRYSGPS